MSEEREQTAYTHEEAHDMHLLLDDLATWPDDAGIDRLVANGEFDSRADAVEAFYFRMLECVTEALERMDCPAAPRPAFSAEDMAEQPF